MAGGARKRGRKSVARAYLERVVLDETAPAPERLKAAIVLLSREADEAKAQRPRANWPANWSEADL